MAPCSHENLTNRNHGMVTPPIGDYRISQDYPGRRTDAFNGGDFAQNSEALRAGVLTHAKPP
jgi:hypothetical protein